MSDVSLKKLITVPALITLAITLLRLVGELMHWSPVLFNRAAGGAGAIVGIAWLVPVFGVYFAIVLAGAGERPAGAGPSIGLPLLGVLLVPLAALVTNKLGMGRQSIATFGVFIVAAIIGALIALRGWPALGRTLLAYGLAARIPVIIVMLIAMLGNWGTHYDVAPPGFPAMGVIQKWLMIGVLPQMTLWLWFTIALGALFGGITAAVKGERRPVTA